MLTVMVWQEYKSARDILRRGDFETVEGIVQHFHRMPAEGHDTERFSLGGVEFKYSSGWGAVYFNSDLNYGYIHDGVRARISYKNEEILKVEVNSADIPTQNKSPIDKR
jgi:hypothetical protein